MSEIKTVLDIIEKENHLKQTWSNVEEVRSIVIQTILPLANPSSEFVVNVKRRLDKRPSPPIPLPTEEPSTTATKRYKVADCFVQFTYIALICSIPVERLASPTPST